jgi:hypothetical protein
MKETIAETKGREKQLAKLRLYHKFYDETLPEDRERRLSKVVRSIKNPLARKAWTKRYDDLFEEMMSYHTEKEVNTLDEFKDHLNAVFEKRLNDGTFGQRHLSMLYDALIKTSSARKYFEDQAKEILKRVTPQEETYNLRFINEKYDSGRKKYSKELRAGAEIYRWYNARAETYVIIHKTVEKGKVKYRQYGSEWYAGNPHRLIPEKGSILGRPPK